jgi:three-Cys-motif partner protein
MKKAHTPKLDKIGDWSVDKLDILKAYAEQYSTILKNQVSRSGSVRTFHVGYIDGFAGAGEHVHKDTGQIVAGSPRNALDLEHRFDEYHFIDIDPVRVAQLKTMCAGHANAHVHQGDCNQLLLNDLFPKFKFADYRRALCFLDPYGMHLQWNVLAVAGQMKSIEIFLNFPVMDINRNAKKKNIADIDPDHRARMTAFWGDESWHAAMYAPSSQGNFHGTLSGLDDNSPELEKNDNEALVAAFRKRLKEVGGFEFVPEPVPMKNSQNAVVYYLFFASNNKTGGKIASHIFKGYTNP